MDEMENTSEMESSDAMHTMETDPNQTEDENLPNTSHDLNETDKLQISSDLAGNDDEDDDDDEIVSSNRTKKRQKGRKFLDSDSEDDGVANKSNEEVDGNKIGDLRVVDTDDEEEEDAKLAQTTSMDKEQSDKEEDNSPQKETMMQKYKSLIDSDTESESEAGNDEEEDNSGNEGQSENEDHSRDEKSHEPKKDLPKRMSAKQAMEQMRSIKSESQRLSREGYVTIPYHEPKQYSLKEFMNRRTLIKPTLKEPRKQFSLKMSSEELEEFARRLDEREEEAKKFFKSDEKRSKGMPIEESTQDQEVEDATETSQVAEAEEPETQDQEKTEVEQNEKPDQEEEFPDTPMQMEEEITDSEFAPMTESQCKLLESEDLFPPGTAESVTIPETEESELAKALILTDQYSTPKLSLSESVSEALREHNVVESPVLTGSPDMLIDLDSGEVIPPTPTGAQKLFERFLKHSAKRKAKESTNMSIVSTENGVLEITNVNVAHQEDERSDEKPGAAYLKMQDNLRKAIMQKRKEEFQKKVQNTRDSDKENDGEEFDGEYVKKGKCVDEEDEVMVDEDENLFEDDDIADDEEDDIDQGNAEVDMQEEEDIQNDEADDEYESGEENDDDDDDELAIETNPQKTRIIKAFDDSDDESQQTDSFNINLIDNITSKNDALWKNEAKSTFDDEEDELLGLCSGRFDPTQKTTVISQIPTHTQPPDGTEESELLALCSGTFQATQAPTEETRIASPTHAAPQRLESSDEETEMDPEMKKSKSKEKKTKKLAFSDDEEENEPPKPNTDEEDDVELNGEKEFDVEPEVPETYIDYDSEENEVEVKMTKTDRKKKARSEFLENEAELSESEWGSADEDEKDLDRYDIRDLADEDEFDKEKLQTELGQIHMRRVLDDDIREVKKLTEMFFEDEENDGVGRQRQFKWKNANGGFDLETGADGEEKMQDGDVEGDEAEWRKMRFEREQMLQEQAAKLGTPDVTLKPVVNTSIGKKLTIVNINSPTIDTLQKSSPFLIAKGLTANRGSFLVRDDVTLSKLANITKLSSGELETGAVQIRTAKAKNFVFAAISSPATNPSKRKLDPTENESETSHYKKLKTGTKRKIRLIDHLA